MQKKAYLLLLNQLIISIDFPFNEQAIFKELGVIVPIHLYVCDVCTSPEIAHLAVIMLKQESQDINDGNFAAREPRKREGETGSSSYM